VQVDRSSRIRLCALGAALALSVVGCGGDSSSDQGEQTATTAQLSRSLGTEDAAEICAASSSDCGRSPKTALDRHPVAVALHDLQRAYLKGDAQGICERMTPSAQTQAGSMAHGTPTVCRDDIRRSLQLFDQGTGWEEAENPEITAIDVDGDEATATVVTGDRRSAAVPFSKGKGGWRLNAFFGVPPSTLPEFVDGAERIPFPGDASRSPAVVGKDGAPCKDVVTSSFPNLAGGCVITFLGNKIRMSVMTPFGAFKFDDCRVSFGLRVDSTGRTWNDYQFVDGPQGGGCGDVDVCEDEQLLDQIPWKGRIERAGADGFVHHAMVCIDTCVGVFVGELEFRLTRDGDKWRAEYVDADIGESGFRLDGTLAGKPRDFDIPPES
jgi:hypothetical protein